MNTDRSDDQAWHDYEYPAGHSHLVDDGVTAVANAAELFTGNRFAVNELSVRLVVGAVIADLISKGRLMPVDLDEREADAGVN